MMDGGELDAEQIIRAFGMEPHPEGGWYAETFRSGSPESEPGTRPKIEPGGGRAAVSTIYFLLRAGERSHWHTVDACEIWLWHAGSPVHLRLSPDGVRSETVLLGSDLKAGERPQVVVPEGVWQAAESAGGWSLVSCVVAPAFEFAGFRMAPIGWEPGWEPGKR
jgi:predicted cupin superfamily sugar epimerase